MELCDKHFPCIILILILATILGGGNYVCVTHGSTEGQHSSPGTPSSFNLCSTDKWLDTQRGCKSLPSGTKIACPGQEPGRLPAWHTVSPSLLCPSHTGHAVLLSGWVVMLLASSPLVLPLLLFSPLRPDQPCLGQLSSHPGPKRKERLHASHSLPSG